MPPRPQRCPAGVVGEVADEPVQVEATALASDLVADEVRHAGASRGADVVEPEVHGAGGRIGAEVSRPERQGTPRIPRVAVQPVPHRTREAPTFRASHFTILVSIHVTLCCWCADLPRYRLAGTGVPRVQGTSTRGTPVPSLTANDGERHRRGPQSACHSCEIGLWSRRTARGGFPVPSTLQGHPEPVYRDSATAAGHRPGAARAGTGRCPPWWRTCPALRRGCRSAGWGPTARRQPGRASPPLRQHRPSC